MSLKARALALTSAGAPAEGAATGLATAHRARVGPGRILRRLFRLKVTPTKRLTGILTV